MRKDIYERIKDACETKHGQSINWLRNRLGKSPSFFRTLKTGDPSISMLTSIADALDVRIEWIVAGTLPMDNTEPGDLSDSRDALLWSGMTSTLQHELIWPLSTGWTKPAVAAALETFSGFCEQLAAEANAADGAGREPSHWAIGETFGRALVGPLERLGFRGDGEICLAPLAYATYAIAFCGSIQGVLVEARREAAKHPDLGITLARSLSACIPVPTLQPPSKRGRRKNGNNEAANL